MAARAAGSLADILEFRQQRPPAAGGRSNHRLDPLTIEPHGQLHAEPFGRRR